jgi:hypothetical protein
MFTKKKKISVTQTLLYMYSIITKGNPLLDQNRGNGVG